jgi:Ca2+-binding EF-hand superfamily protein
MQSSSASKRNAKELSTGQTIMLTGQEERMLRRVYDYWQGIAKRTQLHAKLDVAKAEYTRLYDLVPVSVKNVRADAASLNFKNFYEGDEHTEVELNTAAFLKAKEQIRTIEEKLKKADVVDRHIKVEDVDAVLRKLGCPRTQKEIEFVIWEIDENLDGEVDWEEFQLTYYRNVSDQSGTEPCGFFSILEFLTFDDSNKGYIVEDNCMEILFARYGSEKLEKELQFLFGSQLRSAGGDGTLTLSGYLAAILSRTGRRAIVNS